MNRRSILIWVFLGVIFLPTALNGQGQDAQLQSLATKIADGINNSEKKKVAVWGFVSESGENTSFGKYLTEDFSVYLTNQSLSFQVIDRNHIDVLLQEHKLNSEGYIDSQTAKELKKIIAADALVTGTYTVLSSKVRVRAKVLDTETALQFTAQIVDLPLNDDARGYLGISSDGVDQNRGFQRPMNTREKVNNPKTVDENCEKEGFGDFCFSNSTNEKLMVVVKTKRLERSGYDFRDITLLPKETKCMYKMASGTINYYAIKWSVFVEKLEGNKHWIYGDLNRKNLHDIGELNVAKCQSKTFGF
ncbi:MAG: FlgO family outer membrane protein [Bacteroidota bacterium]